MADTGGTPPVRMSRRRLAALSSIGGLAGGLWTVGLAGLSRGAKPSLTVVGNHGWQVAMLETGPERVLILNGLFEDRADPAVRRLLTTLRQYVDVIVATDSALQQLHRTGPLARSVVIQLDAPPSQTDTPSFRALRQRTTIGVRGGRLDLERIPQREWSNASPSGATWWIRIEMGGLIVVVAPDLETAAMVGPVDTTLTLAPGGDAVTFLGSLPGAAIAANGYSWNDASAQYVTEPTYLIRTFPDDPARFRFDQGRLVLPDWSQELLSPEQGA